MQRGQFTALGLIAGLLVITLVACESGPSEEETAAAQLDEEWVWLEETKATLDAKRAELAERSERIASGVVEEGEATIEELQAQADELAQEVENMTDEFGGRLVAYINEQGIAVGEEMGERQLAAVRMKSSEDMVLAQEFIDKGGDYQRAIGIYEQQLTFDPDNPELKAALARAQELQYMTEERFAQVKKGMTRDQVRDLLGQVNLRNERDFENGKVKGWFYLKEDRSAAGVYFRERRGNWEVYKAEYDAVKAPGEEG